MLVGPMKRRVVLTGVFSALIPIIILGVIGFFMYRGFNEKITELQVKAAVEQRYVIKKDLLANHVLTLSDFELRDFKTESIPSDSYKSGEKDSLIGRRLKLSAKANTIVTKSMFYEDDKEPSIDLRLQEFNMITLPSDLVENDYIDIRVRFPSGEDYSVLVGKKVESYSNDTIFIKLNEDEILTMGSAIIEAYMLDGTKLYANKYVDPANQLFEYKKVDYVAKYDSAVEELLSAKRNEAIAEFILNNPDASEDEAEKAVTLSIDDLDINEIASKIGLSNSETSEIREAKKINSTTILENYKNKEVTTEKKITMTYPVKENVLNIIKTNPNILDEVKEHFNDEAIYAARINMPDTSLTDENISKVNTGLTTEIQAQKQERVAYLRALLEK